LRVPLFSKMCFFYILEVRWRFMPMGSKTWKCLCRMRKKKQMVPIVLMVSPIPVDPFIKIRTSNVSTVFAYYNHSLLKNHS
jgi:hypothetical protein